MKYIILIKYILLICSYILGRISREQITDLVGDLQKEHLKVIHVELTGLCYRTVLCCVRGECTVRSRDIKTNLSDLHIISSQNGEEAK